MPYNALDSQTNMSNMNSSSKERKQESKKETIQSDASWSGEFH